MYILDTDHMTLVFRGRGADSIRLRARLEPVLKELLCSTIVSYEEQTRGWLSYAARARTVAGLVESYRRLGQHLDDWREIPVLPFEERAAIEYQGLLRLRLRVGTMDLRIAAIALARKATLLTRNLRDFRQVPNLHIEDWTV